ncbi:N utilization substance protein B homolog [Candidatus Terasakiella magnetica]|uniref:Transcription antitermination protein NusB n=1 Tax=Candidatus Terasakiella magnetica TaxID=1867952 RepID=A0A1C3RCW8_9PROT|nr:transcription antitermination factor NusB [Candidatus Terasakiella magnetica]SCA55126.1 N utilization substance protein B homolog [Candidatus Terasakiella magnetica]
MNDKVKKSKSVKRSSARLAAVQALYEVELSDSNVDDVLIEFQKTRWNTPQEEGDEDRDTSPLAAPDKQLFTDLLRGVSKRRDELEGIMEGGLSQEWSVDRLEAIVRIILMSGIYELYIRQDVPVRVVITQYVDVAHAFFEGPEPGFVNGVLDRIAKTLRADELTKA